MKWKDGTTYNAGFVSYSSKMFMKYMIGIEIKQAAKIFPHLKLLCWLFMGPTLGFDKKQRNSFFDQIWCFFAIKTRF